MPRVLTGKILCYPLGVLLACLACTRADAGADDALRRPLNEIAQAAVWVARSRGAASIGIGQFTGPPSYASSAGPGMRRILEEELAKLGIQNQRIGAAVGIQGRYTLATQPYGDRKDLRIEVTFVDPNGRVLSDLNQKIKLKFYQEPGFEPMVEDPEFAPTLDIVAGVCSVFVYGDEYDPMGDGILAEVLGATVDLDRPDKDFDDQPVIDSFNDPTAVVHGNTRVAASRNSPFLLEILVGGQPRTIRLESGHPFVELSKGEAFQIRATNRARFSAAVVFRLDGVGSFAFSKVRQTSGPEAGQPRYSRWIIQPGQSFTLLGWHRTNQEVDEFLITDFANSAAAKMNSATDLGTIAVTFRATWKEGQRLPPGEPMRARMEAPGAGIGQGNRRRQQVTEDTARREYGIPRAVVTIRYAKPSDG